jgi:hypothetical protein
VGMSDIIHMAGWLRPEAEDVAGPQRHLPRGGRRGGRRRRRGTME